MEGSSLAKRRIAWATLAILNGFGGPLFDSVAGWQSYWLLSIGTTIGLVPMVYRQPATDGIGLWLPMGLAILCSLGGLVLVFVRSA